MPAGNALSEIAGFERCDQAEAKRLCEHLRPRWSGRAHALDEAALVVVGIRRRKGDLAALLRAAT